MEVGGFKRIVVLDTDSQLDINSKIVSSANTNFDRLYKAMNSGIDFEINVNCAILSVSAKHGQEQTVTHGLTQIPKNIIVMSGLAKLIVESTDFRVIKIKTYLPQTFLTKDVTGNTITVADPYSFSAGETIILQRTGNFDAQEVAIDSIDLKNRNIKLKSNVQASTFDLIHKKAENIKLMVF